MRKKLTQALLLQRVRRAERQARRAERKVRRLEQAATKARLQVAALRRNEMRYQALFENARMGIALAQPDGQLIEANKAYSAMLGYSLKELRDLSFADFTHPEDLAKERLYIQEILAGRRASYDIEKRYFRKDGTTLWVHLYAGFIADAEGSPALGFAVVQDISARKAAEHAQRESESRWRMALDAGHMAAWEFDLRTGENFWDNHLADLLGIPADQVAAAANRWLDTVHPADRPRVQTEFSAACQEGAPPFNSEFRVIRADGGERWLHSQAAMFQQPDGTRLMRGVVQDITCQKRLEEELRISEAKFRALFENASQGIVLGDVASRIAMANPKFAAITGYSQEELLALEIDDLIHPKDLARIKSRIREIRNNRRTGYEDERRYIRKDGKVIWVHAVAGVIRDASGNAMFGVVVVEDITERRQTKEWLERQVAERTVELRHRSRQLAELASELTLAEQRERWRLANHLHDQLQQILVGTRLQLSALASRLKPEFLEDFDVLHGALSEAIAVTRNVTQELAPPIAFYQHLSEAFRWLVREIQKRHKLVVRCRIEGRLHTLSESKSVLLYTAARELLLNVVKHAGTLRADLRLRRIADDVVLEVHDAGVGFDPIVQGRRKKLGFGLFSIRERVELLGGTFRLTSVPGRGVRIVLRIPAGEAPAGRKPAAPGRAAASPARK